MLCYFLLTICLYKILLIYKLLIYNKLLYLILSSDERRNNLLYSFLSLFNLYYYFLLLHWLFFNFLT